jgi:Ca-activated chloride channel family protein
MFESPFENPEFFWLLVLLLPYAAHQILKFYRQRPVLTISESFKIEHTGANILGRLAFLPLLLRFMALVVFVVAMARPRSSEPSTKTRAQEGIDIVLSVDISASMLAQDLQPTRLEALKKVATEFVKQRPSDRFGLVLYAGEGFTQTPITSDHAVVLNRIAETKYGMVEDGTAIGLGLATAINRLRNSTAKSKVVILLTDGENNRGSIDPLTAADMAKTFGIKVYTIAVGTIGNARMPVARSMTGAFIYDDVPVSIDEELLKKIAQTTKGAYFRATDNATLKKIYDEIDQLETSTVEELRYFDYQELFYNWAFAGLLLLLIEFVIRRTLFKSIV